jgi:glycosyltransferase involved in cell wall biosynthesis
MDSIKRTHKINRIAYLCLQATVQGQASYAHVHEIIKGLEHRGLRVELFQPNYSNRKHAPGAFIRCFEFIRVQARLLLKLKRFECLYIRSHFATLPIALLAKLAGIPVVQEVNGSYDDLFACWPWTRMVSRLFIAASRKQWEIANAIIVVAHNMGKWVEREAGNSNWYVVPNGADVSIFHPDAVPELGLSLPEAPYVVFFGALSNWQGIGPLLEAAGCSAWPNLALVIAGDGPLRGEVEAAARENPQIKYLGKLPYRQIPAIVAKSIASISPQTLDGMRSITSMSPLKVYESMACGVPVIVTEIPGTAEIVAELNCGLVIPHKDPKAIASTVAFLFAHPKVRLELGRNGRAAAIRDHSWDHRSESTFKVLCQFVSNQTGESGKSQFSPAR